MQVADQMLRPEVMHSLHCVNAIRKAMHHEYYLTHDTHKLPAALQQIHVGKLKMFHTSVYKAYICPEHCLDQIRQNIQCAGDLTPVQLRPYGVEPNVNLVGTPQIHTCRNWAKFREFYTRRGHEYGHVSSGGT